MSETSWINRWKNSKPTELKKPDGPRVMSPSEEIANLRKSPELRDPRNPGHAAAARRLSDLYKEIYGDQVEEDNAR